MNFRVRLARNEECDRIQEMRAIAFATRRGMYANAVRLLDHYDRKPNCRSYFLETGDGDVIGSIRVCVLGDRFESAAIPAQEFFPDEIHRLMDSSTGLVQPALLSIAPKWRKFGPEPALSLVRSLLAAALAFGAEHAVTLLDNHRSKQRFWERVGFKSIGSVKEHPLSVHGVILAFARVEDVLNLAKSTKGYESLVRFEGTVSRQDEFPEIV